MNLLTRIPSLRWAVPAAAVVVILGGGATLGGLTASATPELPARTASQLLLDVEHASAVPFSGTIVESSDLGIPSLPGIGGMSSSDLTSLLSGTHTLRLWYSGPDKARLALLGTLGESDVIRNGADTWIWSSRDNIADHRKIKAGAAPQKLPTELPTNPQDAAAAALKAVGTSTSVTTETGAKVAGRAVYELVLKPADQRSLVGQVRIAIDADHHIPLRVQVFAVGQAGTAFEVGFSSVSFDRPDDAQFTFNPPPGATVTTDGGQQAPDRPITKGIQALSTEGMPVPATAAPKVVGSGWTSVVVAPSGAVLGILSGGRGAGSSRAGSSSGAGSLVGMIGALPRVSGAWGSGHLLAGKLFSVLITDDGTVAGGAVKPELLYAALTAK